MSRYRWLRPLKCIESMECFEGTQNKSFKENEKLLFEKVASGDIRAMLNDAIIPKAHIAVYLALYQRANPEQDAHTIAPDVGINYDDLCAVFDRPRLDTRKPGRPRAENAGWSDDRRLADEMHKMLAGHPKFPRAESATAAARILVEQGRVSGAGTDESRVKRLVRKFRHYYSS